MESVNEPNLGPGVPDISGISARMSKAPIIGFFWEKSFLHYLWIGGAYSLLGVFLLWLFIDILKMPTIVASTIVIGGTFILRYILFRVLNIM